MFPGTAYLILDSNDVIKRICHLNEQYLNMDEPN